MIFVFLGNGEGRDARLAKVNIAESDGKQTVQSDRYGTRTMGEQPWRIEVSIVRETCHCDVRSIGNKAEIRNEPHPVPADGDRDSDWCKNAENQSCPQSHQGIGIGIK